MHNSLGPVSATPEYTNGAVSAPIRSTSTGQDLITAELAKLRARHTLDLHRAQRLTRDQQQIRYLAPTPPLSDIRSHLEQVYAEIKRDAA